MAAIKPSPSIFDESSFRKSTRSSHAGECVEFAIKGDFIGVRDSQDPSHHVLVYTRAEWRAFVDGVKSGEFDA